ncbi:hypothetical protein F3Y22_tig00117046pilonHSYRG00033 [Hibiscus syriacus]|uniref:BED-type domain-containing protein n=1 Tax=Hibiscus syriacus TaxID=106335 RepID=A0A6A2XDV6_HIBSY|nr:hypothetical protein F3Y22_tig00117046pilonHSYRG00033 [Hibiscus syriacus]
MPPCEEFPTKGSEGAPSNDIGWHFGTPVPNARGSTACKLCGKVVKGGITRFKEHIAHKTRNVAPSPNVIDQLEDIVEKEQVNPSRVSLSLPYEELHLNWLEVQAQNNQSKGTVFWKSIDVSSVRSIDVELYYNFQVCLLSWFLNLALDLVFDLISTSEFSGSKRVATRRLRVLQTHSGNKTYDDCIQKNTQDVSVSYGECKDQYIVKKKVNGGSGINRHQPLNGSLSENRRNQASINCRAGNYHGGELGGVRVKSRLIKDKLKRSHLQASSANKDTSSAQNAAVVVHDGIKELPKKRCCDEKPGEVARSEKIGLNNWWKEDHPKISNGYRSDCFTLFIENLPEKIHWKSVSLAKFKPRQSFWRKTATNVHRNSGMEVGWCKEFIKISHLARQMQTKGLTGFSLMRAIRNTVLMIFEDSASLRSVKNDKSKTLAKWFSRVEAWSESLVVECRRVLTKADVRIDATLELKEFKESKWGQQKTRPAYEAKKIILGKDFWKKANDLIKVYEPLVKVLKLVDSDEKPTMGFIYEAVDRAKQHSDNVLIETLEGTRSVIERLEPSLDSQVRMVNQIRHQKRMNIDDINTSFNPINLYHIFEDVDPLSEWLQEKENPFSSATPSQSGDGLDGGGLSPIDDDDDGGGGGGGGRDEIRSSSRYGREYGVGTTSGHFCDRSEFGGNISPKARRDRSETKAPSKGKCKKHTSVGSSSSRRSSSSNLGQGDSSTSTQGHENQVKKPLKMKVKDLNLLVIPLIVMIAQDSDDIFKGFESS